MRSARRSARSTSPRPRSSAKRKSSASDCSCVSFAPSTFPSSSGPKSVTVARTGTPSPIPPSDRNSTGYDGGLVRQPEVGHPLRRRAVRGARVAQPGQISLVVGREHRDARVGELLRDQLQRPCLARAGGARDQPVSIHRRHRQAHERARHDGAVVDAEPEIDGVAFAPCRRRAIAVPKSALEGAVMSAILSGAEKRRPERQVDVAGRRDVVARTDRLAEQRGSRACAASAGRRRPSQSGRAPLAPRPAHARAGARTAAATARARGRRSGRRSCRSNAADRAAVVKTCSGAIVSTANPRCAPPSQGAGASTETRRTFVAEYVEMKSAIWPRGRRAWPEPLLDAVAREPVGDDRAGVGLGDVRGHECGAVARELLPPKRSRTIARSAASTVCGSTGWSARRTTRSQQRRRGGRKIAGQRCRTPDVGLPRSSGCRTCTGRRPAARSGLRSATC